MRAKTRVWEGLRLLYVWRCPRSRWPCGCGCSGRPCGSYQNGGYWATPLAWLYPALARANFSLAAQLLQDVIVDFQDHGINEAVNHDFTYNPLQKKGPKTYTGVMGYLASAASVYAAVWTPVGTGGGPPAPPAPPRPASECPCNPPGQQCAASATVPSSASSSRASGCNLTGYWTGSWDGNAYHYAWQESSNGSVTVCSRLRKDCWWEALGQHAQGTLQLTFKRCKPFPDVMARLCVSATHTLPIITTRQCLGILCSRYLTPSVTAGKVPSHLRLRQCQRCRREVHTGRQSRLTERLNAID